MFLQQKEEAPHQGITEAPPLCSMLAVLSGETCCSCGCGKLDVRQGSRFPETGESCQVVTSHRHPHHGELLLPSLICDFGGSDPLTFIVT